VVPRLAVMTGEHPADMKIQEAIDEGRLDSSAHRGKPLPSMRQNNPGWWITAFLEREKLPERLHEASVEADAMLLRAVNSATLSEARQILADRNLGVAAWNAAVLDDHHLDVIEETDLLTMRQIRRPTTDDGRAKS
jgi:DnaJ homologue, subfamily C, member 28, conserved domain